MPRRTSAREIARFLHHLSQTGNFALACDRIGRGKAGLYKRRATDPLFAAQCDAAIAVARIHLSSPSSGGGSPKAVVGTPRRPNPRAPLRTEGGEVQLSVAYHRAPQLRRTPAGRLTPAGVEAFLIALAATANVRLSAASVGVAPSSIYARYRRHEGFRERMDAALRMGCDTLEMAMMRRALADHGGADPFAPWTAPPEEARTAALPPPPPEPAIAEMTPHEALRLLKLHREHTLRRPPRQPTLEEVAPSIIRKLNAVDRFGKP